jgi:hypothetical protein
VGVWREESGGILRERKMERERTEGNGGVLLGHGSFLFVCSKQATLEPSSGASDMGYGRVDRGLLERGYHPHLHSRHGDMQAFEELLPEWVINDLDCVLPNQGIML